MKLEKKLVSFLTLFLCIQLSFFFAIIASNSTKKEMCACTKAKKESPDHYLETSKDCTVVIKFFSPWCPSCKEIGQTFQCVAEDLGSQKYQFFSVNIDQIDQNNDDFITTFSVKSIPTIIILKDKAVKERITGIITSDALKEKILDCNR